MKLEEDPAEIDRARDELTGGGPTAYVVLRVTDYGDQPETEGGRNLRRLIAEGGYVSRGPTAGEKEAPRRGLPPVISPAGDLASWDDRHQGLPGSRASASMHQSVTGWSSPRTRR